MTDQEPLPIVVVGAGLAGLACARALADAGRAPVVLERARGVGGRCATRRLDGQPLDFGTPFLHGRDPAFLAALAEVPGDRFPGWPREIHGSGRPCQPQAFAPGEERVAFAAGVNAFPKHLSRGLDVRLETPVAALLPSSLPGAVTLDLGDKGRLAARTVVLALAGEQVRALVDPVAGEPSLAVASALLDTASSEPCLALLAVYPDGTPPPTWDAALPEDSRVLQVAWHDSAKRPTQPGARLALVLQAHGPWSARHLEDGAWPEALLAEAGRVLGDWVARPEVVQQHRWRYARTDRSAELAGPMLLGLTGGGRIGICGDRFAPGGGAEGAWRSGTIMARRLLAGEGVR